MYVDKCGLSCTHENKEADKHVINLVARYLVVLGLARVHRRWSECNIQCGNYRLVQL